MNRKVKLLELNQLLDKIENLNISQEKQDENVNMIVKNTREKILLYENNNKSERTKSIIYNLLICIIDVILLIIFLNFFSLINLFILIIILLGEIKFILEGFFKLSSYLNYDNINYINKFLKSIAIKKQYPLIKRDYSYFVEEDGVYKEIDDNIPDIENRKEITISTYFEIDEILLDLEYCEDIG